MSALSSVRDTAVAAAALAALVAPGTGVASTTAAALRAVNLLLAARVAYVGARRLAAVVQLVHSLRQGYYRGTL